MKRHKFDYRWTLEDAHFTEGMGHDSEMTTRIYLASLDTSDVDKANRKLIEKF